MSLEKKLVSACAASREAWEKAHKHLNFQELTPVLQLTLKLIGEYYEADIKAESVDRDVLLKRVEMSFDNPKKASAYVANVQECFAFDVSATNVIDLLLDVKREALKHKMLQAVANEDEESLTLIREYQELLEAQELPGLDDEDEGFKGISVDEIVANVLDPASLIKLAPAALNTAIGGGVLRGHHVTIFARPEVGKTAMVITQLVSFAMQGLEVIYFGNEDPLLSIMQRTMSCMTGMDADALRANKDKAAQILRERGWDRIRFIPLTPGTPAQIERYLKRYKPDAFVLDQLRNLLVTGAGNKVEQLEEGAKCCRRCAQRYNCVAVSVTQAGDSATNKLVLDMGDVDSSNTGIPGQADLMVGIGMNAEYEAAELRCLSLPKNKINGNHTHIPVRIHPRISRYTNP